MEFVLILWAGSTLAIIGNKKMEWTNHFGQVLAFSKQIIRARWGLTFSITEQCFGHQIVTFGRIVLNFGGQAPL